MYTGIERTSDCYAHSTQRAISMGVVSSFEGLLRKALGVVSYDLGIAAASQTCTSWHFLFAFPWRLICLLAQPLSLHGPGLIDSRLLPSYTDWRGLGTTMGLGRYEKTISHSLYDNFLHV